MEALFILTVGNEFFEGVEDFEGLGRCAVLGFEREKAQLLTEEQANNYILDFPELIKKKVLTNNN